VTDGLRLTWLGHSSVVIDLHGVRLITDPLLLDRVGPLRRRGSRPEADSWAGADAVLLSHLHHDHAHLKSLRLLPDVPVVTAPANVPWLRRHGITEAIELDDGGEFVVRERVRVRPTPAIHGHRPMPHRPNAANGHLVQSPNVTVWIVGDTELYPEMADLPALAGAPIDIAVVPVGGWAPRLSGGHLGPAAAAQACARVGARWAVPVHWGTLHVRGAANVPMGWMDRPGPAFVDAVGRVAPDCRAVLLSPGQSWDVSDHP
jgi:L-ascorbate metabolism protein UlaG (beta-lactamase superfamily)